MIEGQVWAQQKIVSNDVTKNFHNYEESLVVQWGKFLFMLHIR